MQDKFINNLRLRELQFQRQETYKKGKEIPKKVEEKRVVQLKPVDGERAEKSEALKLFQPIGAPIRLKAQKVEPSVVVPAPALEVFRVASLSVSCNNSANLYTTAILGIYILYDYLKRKFFGKPS